jgi:hypothetical protein
VAKFRKPRPHADGQLVEAPEVQAYQQAVLTESKEYARAVARLRECTATCATTAAAAAHEAIHRASALGTDELQHSLMLLAGVARNSMARVSDTPLALLLACLRSADPGAGQAVLKSVSLLAGGWGRRLRAFPFAAAAAG